MSEWEPATDAEVAMRDALRTDDQESYFRILSGVDLLLPVSADALAGLAPLGWGTWSTGGRTHVLAFTSTAALQACLADYTGSARRVPYAELANTWPNLEWWLAVNPGLPIEGYLPAWFVAQLSRGDLRLPTRGPGRDTGPAKIQDRHAAALAANAAVTRQEEAASRAGGPTHEPAEPAEPAGGYPHYPVSAPPAPAYPQQPAAAAAAPVRAVGPEPGPEWAAEPRPDQVGPGGLPVRTPSGVLPSGLPSRAAAATNPAPASAGSVAVPSAYRPPSLPVSGAGPAAPTSGPAAVMPSSGLPSPGAGPAAPVSAPGGVMPGGPAGPGVMPGGQSGPGGPGVMPGGPGGPGVMPGGPGGPGVMPGGQVGPGVMPGGQSGPSGPGVMPGMPAGPGGMPSGQGVPGGAAPGGPGAAMPTSGAAAMPTSGAAAMPTSGATAWHPSGPGEARPNRGPESRGGPQDPSGPLPVRTPMAQTPPVPEHFTPHNPDDTPFDPHWPGPAGASSTAARWSGGATPAELPRRHPADQGGSFPQGPASPQAAAAQQAYPTPVAPPAQPAQGPGFGSPLPRRQATPPSEQSPMTSFPGFASPSDVAPPAEAAIAPSAAPTRPGLPPPVVPGSPGSDRPARLGAVPPLEARNPAPAPPAVAEEAFVPANEVERDLFAAAGDGSTDGFLSTLLLATVLVPVAHHSRPGSAPGESGFAFRTEDMDGEHFLIVFTSKDRLAEHYAEPTRTVGVRFYELIRNWPDPAWSFAVNPGTPVGAKYPGPQVIALANWANEAGLGAEPVDGPFDDTVAPVPAPQPASDDAQHATVMQKTVPPEQVDYYLERGYDRVAGFVHRATEVEHLRTPGELFAALGLGYGSSPHQPDAKEAYVLRWPAYRPSLYRIPYGGQNEQALRAMDGWVIERAPFRGNGFAPGEGRDVIAEFKVDSVRLPHGAQLWRIDADGTERMVAIFDNDGPIWRRVGEH